MASLLQIGILIFGLLVLCTSVNLNSTPGPTDCDSRYRKKDTGECAPHLYSREDKQIRLKDIYCQYCNSTYNITTTPTESQNHYPALSIQSMCVSGIVTVPLITSMIVRHILTQQQAQILNQQEQVLDIWAYMEPPDISTADIVQLHIYAVKTKDELAKEEILAYEKKKKSGRCAVPTKFVLKTNGESLKVTVKDIFPPSQWTVHSSLTKNIALENIELGGLGGRCDFLFILNKNAVSNSGSHLIGVFDLAQKGNTHVVKAVCFTQYHTQPEEKACDTQYCQTMKEPKAWDTKYCQIQETKACDTKYCQTQEAKACDTKYCQTQEAKACDTKYCLTQEVKACDTKYCQTQETDENPETQDFINMDKCGKDQMRETARQSISILVEVPPILSSYCNGEVTSKNTLTNDNSMEMSIEKSGESQTREEMENVLKVVSPAAVASNDPPVVDEKDLDHEGLKQEEIQKWNETFAFEIPTLNGHTAESIFANF